MSPAAGQRQDEVVRSIAELIELVRRVDARLGDLETSFGTLTAAFEAAANAPATNGASSNGSPAHDAALNGVGHGAPDDAEDVPVERGRIANLRSPSAEISRASARIQEASASGGRRVASTRSRARTPRAQAAE